MRRFLDHCRDVPQNFARPKWHLHTRSHLHAADEFLRNGIIELLANRHFQSHARDQSRPWIFRGHDQAATCPIRFAPASSNRVASAIFDANAFTLKFGPIAFASSATRSTAADTERNCAPDSKTNWHAVATSP